MSEKVTIGDLESTATPWPKELLKGLDEMRSSSILCDVVINTNDNKYYSVHSAVLAAGSSFFCEILNQSKMSGAGIVIKLEKPSCLVEALISFLYTGLTDIDAEDIEGLKVMAEGYGLNHLMKLCLDKQYVLTLGNLVKATEGVEGNLVKVAEGVEVPEHEDPIEESELTDQMAIECETEAPVSDDPDLSTVEIQMESLTKAIDIAPMGLTSRPQRRAYNTGGPKKTWRDYKYSCSFCGKVFTSLSRMQGHQALHTGDKKHECNICGQRFIQIEYLREHVSIHSTNKPFKCDQCAMTFRLGRHLKKHQRTHNTDRRFECELCHKLFKRNVGLSQHMRIHNGEKPYECAQCERRFRHKEALHRHKNAVHTENCPFKCGYCNVGFSQLAGLKDHQSYCSIAKQMRFLVCEHCNKTFQTSRTLNRHIQLKHPGMPSNYKKVAEEEVQKAALRTRDVEDDNADQMEQEDGVNHENEVDHVTPVEVEGLLGEELVVDQDTSEIILRSLEKGIVLQEGGGLEIQTDEDGRMVYQVLTLQMGDDDEETAVLTTTPIMEATEVDGIPDEDS